MNPRSLFLAALLAATANLAHAYSGLYGRTLSGVLERSPYYEPNISAPLNSSNLGSPLAQVNGSLEFSAECDDLFFGQHFVLTADWNDNFQVFLHESSPSYQANVTAGDWFLRWHFYGFDFSVADVQLLSGPPPEWDRSILTFDADNIWIAFNGLYAVPGWDSYTFQVVPVPEPATATLCALAGLLCLLRRATARTPCWPAPRPCW